MNSRLRLHERLILCAVLGVALVSVLQSFSPDRAPQASAETRFVEMSASGLAIVPASCPSDPHYSGECSPPPPSCPSGYISTDFGYCMCNSGGGCPAPRVCANGLNYTNYPTCACPTGYVQSGSSCVVPVQPGSCANGLSIAQYPSCTCPDGTAQSGSSCVGNQCVNTYYCNGNDLWVNNSCTGAAFVNGCAYGCASGGCRPAPVGDGNITASPSLIHRGETSIISWSTSGMVEGSCRVIENNPDINDSWTGESGERTSSPIRAQTAYTLICTKSTGGEFRDNATVNVIPIFQEQ